MPPPADPPPPGPKTALKDPPPGKQGPAILDASARHDGKTLAEWIARLGDADDLTRTTAADAVAKYGPNAKAAVPSLVALLRNPDDLSFEAAVMAIGEIGPVAGDAVDPLVVLLRHKKADVREAAAGTVWRLGPPAGKAVPALIDALDAAGPGGETARDAFRFPIQQLGKYDIRAVYAAVRRDKLTEQDLGFVIGSLDPDDDQAVAGLVAELKDRAADPVTGNWDIYTLSGLKRIGPKAAPALPAVRALLTDRSPEVRKAAAEAVAAIGAGAGADAPARPAPTPDAKPEDVRQVLTGAGFDEKLDWGRHLALHVRFGSKAAADKYLRGDRFDKIEAERAAQGHRAAVRETRFRVDGLKFRPVVRGDVETRGLVAELDLPMRVRGGEPFYQDAAAFTGVLAGLHPSELDARRTSFLTKDGTLRPCTPAEAAAVERNGGVLYQPEVASTTLVLLFKDRLDVLKGLAREAKGYAVELEFSDLHSARPLAWGHFRRDAYLAADWDCQKLWADHLLDPDGPQPVCFTIRSPTRTRG